MVLDGIQDPQNVGAIARSAEACGADGIVVPRHHAAPLTAAAVKASAGATEHLPMVTVPNLAQALEVIGEAGIWRVGLDADGRDRYDVVDLAGPVAIVVGRRGRRDAPADARALRRARVDSDDGSRRFAQCRRRRRGARSSRCNASAASHRADGSAMHALIVDGYNIIHAWPALQRRCATRGLEDARRQLVNALGEYAAQTGVAVTIVFDGHVASRGLPSTEKFDGVTVLFGSKRASADHVIERAAYKASQRGEGADVVVATDDRLERDVVGAHGRGDHGGASARGGGSRVAGSVDTETRRMRDDSRRTPGSRTGSIPRSGAGSNASGAARIGEG